MPEPLKAWPTPGKPTRAEWLATARAVARGIGSGRDWKDSQAFGEAVADATDAILARAPARKPTSQGAPGQA